LGGYQFPAEWYMPAHIIQRNPNDQPTLANQPTSPPTYAESTIDILFVNGASGSVKQGYVGVVDSGLGAPGKTLIAATSADQNLPIVVAGGLGGTLYPSGQNVPVARSGSEAVVNTTGTVNPGDTLVTSTTAGYAKADNLQTNPEMILGYALATISSGNILTRIK
jgi:hypothetical protein